MHVLNEDVYSEGIIRHEIYKYVSSIPCLPLQFLMHPQNPLIQPVVTPRFAISCSEPLLKALGDLAQEMEVPIQSHICEQKDEVDYTLKIYTQHKTCSAIFQKAGLSTKVMFS